MSSSIKMEEYMETELSGIFTVKTVGGKIMLGYPRTHFVYMRVQTVKDADD